MCRYLSTFNGYIKSCDSAKLRSCMDSQLKDIFPAFFDDEFPELRMNPDTWQPQIRLQALPPRRRPSRRFGGYFDEVSLPRGRYYTVAQDNRGNDRGTLARELFAYSAPTRHISIIDTTQQPNIQYLQQRGIECTAPGSLVVIFEPLIAHSKKFIEIPVLTENVTVSNCVDLRDQVTQQWFYGQFRNGTEDILFVPGAGIVVQEFTDMLPGLVWPSLGGGGIQEPGSITRAIGYWMRTNRVSALIYPSARCDTFVRYESGKVMDFYGWNLVDYRNTWEDANILRVKRMMMTSMSGWPSGLPYQWTLRVDKWGSWQINGPEDYSLRRLHIRPSDDS